MTTPFRPSYQGWKPDRFRRRLGIKVLLDLPIRDGNRIANRLAPPAGSLLDLPISRDEGDQLAVQNRPWVQNRVKVILIFPEALI